MNLTKDMRNAASTVGRLAPSNDRDHLTGRNLSTSGRKTAGLDVVVEGDCLWELNKGDIVGQIIVVPVLVGESVVGSDFNSVGLAVLSDVVGSGEDVVVAGAIHAVSGGQDPLLGDQRASAEPSVIDEEGDDPGVLVGGGFFATDNFVHGRGSFDSTFGKQVVLGGLGSNLGPQLLGFPNSIQIEERKKFLIVFLFFFLYLS